MGDLLTNLNINPTVLLMNGVLFLVLLVIMNAIFWKPMMRHLEKRKEDIADAYKTVEDTRRELDNLRTDYQARLNRIEADARGRIQQTVRDAQHQREEVIAQARAEAEQILAQGQSSIAQEKEQTIASMRDSLDDVALSALSRALNAPTDAAQRRLIDEYIVQNVLKS